ncbi:MAG: hypothetical protein LBU89_00540 [Fibromonadaceae bacterium]|jgi:1,4-alpha-glucan branching enzyme|nr:hypothetical protein [Fibromonadaceae bacterium]
MAVKKETKTAKPAAKVAKATKTVKAAAPKAKKEAPKAKKEAPKGKVVKGKVVDVTFKVFAPNSDSVAVAGDFNGWKPLSLKKDKAGYWSGKTKLQTGVYQYKLVFNGQYWETDMSNPERISDGHGGENSIKRV